MQFGNTNAGYTVSNDGLTVTKDIGGWGNEIITPIITAPTIVDIYIDNLGGVMSFGIKSPAAPITAFIGQVAGTYGMIWDGRKFYSNIGSNYGAALATGQKISISYNPFVGELEFFVNDLSRGVAFTGITGDYYFAVSGDSVGCQASIIPRSSSVSLYSEQVIATRLSLLSNQLISPAPHLYHQVIQILATARKLSLEVNQEYDTATPLYLQFDAPIEGLAAVQIAFEQIVQGFGPPVALEFLQTWYNHGYNEAILPFVQVIGGQVHSSAQQLQFSVTVAGVRVGVTACTFDRSGLAVLATLTLRSHADWANKWPGDTVVITWLGEQYNLVVVDKPSQGQVGQETFENSYIIECMSMTFQLSEDFNNDLSASRVTLSYQSGTLATEILDDLTTGVCSYSLNVPDFPVGTFEFDDAERYTALLQVFPASYGWVLNTDKNGVLQVSSFQFPGSAAVQKSLYFTSKSLTPPEGILYNKVSIKNFDQASGTTGLRLEVVDNGDGTGTIYGYSVPWSPDFSIFDSEDSAAPSLIIRGGLVEEVEVTDDNLEFVDFAASLSKPCYSTPVIQWGGNDSLEPITFDESGGLVTATEPGYSVATSSTYTTRRKTWTYDNRRTDPTQARIEYD